MFGLFKKKQTPESLEAQALYDVVVTQARKPHFYEEVNVPDDIDGRFEMISLHQLLVLFRMEQLGEDAKALSQELFDKMFLDMDRSLREMGISDLSVPKHMKRMLQGFNGRTHAYKDAILNNDIETLSAALRRNAYGSAKEPINDETVEKMCGYIDKQWQHLCGLDLKNFKTAGNIFIEDI